MSVKNETDNQACDSIAEEVLITVRKIVQSIDLHSSFLFKNHDITVPQLIALKMLRHKALSCSELTSRLSLTLPTVMGIVKRLETKKYLKRYKSETDRRQIIVELTENGKNFLATGPKLLQDRFLNKFDELDEWERLMLLSALKRLAYLIQAEEIEAAPILTVGSIDPKTGSN